MRSVCRGAAVALALAPLRAHAASPRVTLEAVSCEAFPVDEARRVLAVELGASQEAAPDAGTTRVTITCDGANALVVVHDPLSKKTLERRVALALEAPRARGRLLGVAAAELVLASWSELATNPEPRVPSTEPAPPPEALAAAREVAMTRLVELREHRDRSDAKEAVARPLRLSAVASRRAFFTMDGAMWGGGARIGQDVFTHLGWSADVLGESGEIATPLGAYQLDSGTVGGAILAYHATGPLVARAGAGLRLGVARAAEVTGPAKTSTLAPWGWPTGNLALTLTPVGPLIVELAGEVGYVVLPVTSSVAGVTDATIRGTWFGLQLGLGVAL